MTVRVRRSGAKLNRARWGRAKKAIFKRDGWGCVKCGSNEELTVDHIRPRKLGGAKYDLHNLQTLCQPCHIHKSKREHHL